ncbi:MAG TPA: molecular chaperone HtpG [Legionellales bacterium]|nr:molecular chaperone HtpG [Legionellales bacterium]
MADSKTLGFQAEVKQLLNLVVHSLYSNKEIFLRELISNASDALDKLRFLGLSDSKLYENDSDLKITIRFNENLKTLTISDNGIGMTWDEAVQNLGTIAKSGTKEFLSHLTGEQSKDSHLIGQFGVGFYSAFIVADKVTVISRKASMPVKEGIQWESDGEGEFTIQNHAKESRGTDIILHLREDSLDFLSDWRIRGIVTKYSDHIAWPIAMKKLAQLEEGEETSIEEFETVNKATALWTLNKSEIAEEEYQKFYQSLTHDFQNPLAWSHNHVEGKQHYISLLYIPETAPFDLWQHDAKHGLKLYVKRVFIMDDATQFLPRYMRFVKGVIDASDLPLNVSREILQENKQVEAIRAACSKRVLSMLEKMSESQPELYAKFWQNFGNVLKEGPMEDFANKENIAKLLRFASTHLQSSEQNVSLDDYISRMKEGQDKIYYITANSYNAAKTSPHLEIFQQKGIEVLLLSDRVDEWLVGYLSEYAGKKLLSIAKGKLDLPVSEEKDQENPAEVMPMIEQMKKILESDVKDVRTTTRLTQSPACIVADENDLGLEMQRILKATGQQLPETKPILEVNPHHPLIQKMHQITDDELFKEWAKMMFEQAVLAEGGHLDNPAAYVARVNQLLAKA